MMMIIDERGGSGGDQDSGINVDIDDDDDDDDNVDDEKKCYKSSVSTIRSPLSVS